MNIISHKRRILVGLRKIGESSEEATQQGLSVMYDSAMLTQYWE